MVQQVEIEVLRGSVVESRHIGSAAVMRYDGTIEMQFGDVESPVFARSAVKPLQAVPLLESGAADHFRLGDTEIALACASHNGEPRHVAAVRAWLERVGLTEAALECGAHVPSRLIAYAELVRSGEQLSAAYNNCSGKHSGFLTTAVHLGLPTAGYIKADHPVQIGLRKVYSELSGVDLEQAPVGTDGCGIPTLGVSLRGMATAMARMANPTGLAAPRIAAIRRIQNAMWNQPFMVAGTDRFCTQVNGLLRGKAAVKTGAEGVFCGMLPQLGLGIALKIHDGASRASEVAMAALLRRVGVLDSDANRSLIEPPIYNVAGAIVGGMRPAQRWLAP